MEIRKKIEQLTDKVFSDSFQAKMLCVFFAFMGVGFAYAGAFNPIFFIPSICSIILAFIIIG